jgi:hypothetical protein
VQKMTGGSQGSRPEAVLVSHEDSLRFKALQEGEVLVRFDALTSRLAERNGSYDDDEVAADIETARSYADLDRRSKP